MRPLAPLAALALLAAGAGPAAAAEPRPKVAVLDFAANGASREVASAATGMAATELDRLGVFKVVTSEAIRDLLAFERQRQMLGGGCADQGCLAELGGALGVDYLVSGKVSRLAAGGGAPETFALELTLSAVKKSQREGSAVETARSEAELVTRVGRAVQRLVQKVLAGRAGALAVASDEAGAVVRVDEQVMGTTPLQGQLPLPAGPHALVVEKEGFVAFQKEIQVQPGRLTEERVLLVPSPDFIREYEARQRRLRTGAWISTGVAVAGLAGAVLLQAEATRLYGTETTPGTFLYDRRKLLDGVTSEGGKDLRAEAQALQADIRQAQTLSWVSAGVGAVAAAAATWFWVAGDDPDRYARFREQRAGLGVAPLPGGALAAVHLRF